MGFTINNIIAKRNDENRLIIHDKKVAEKFLEEFEELFEQE